MRDFSIMVISNYYDCYFYTYIANHVHKEAKSMESKCKCSHIDQSLFILLNSFADKLEYLNPTEKTAIAAEGTWELIYTNTNLFRTSPLFMSARAFATGEQSVQFNEITDRFINSLKFARIGRVTQVITPFSVSSEIETEIPVFPGSVTGTIISMAEIESATDDSVTLVTDNIRIKEGTSNIPLFGELINNFSGISVKSLSSSVPSFESPKPILSITYVDQDLRISRDQDFNVFVFTKVIN
jgi:hypothetical protein